ncbi:MAG: hypothetical protein ACXVA9_13185, partial [Bdellovibrionales bacterium]
MKKSLLVLTLGLIVTSSAFAGVGPNCDQSAACRKIRPAVIRVLAERIPQVLAETNFNREIPFSNSPGLYQVIEEKLQLTRAFEFELRKACLISVGREGEM